MKERRIAQRFMLNIPVDSAGLNKKAQNLITNISTTGLFISTKSPIPEGEKLDMQFTLPEKKGKLKVSGVVAWSRSKGENPGIGVEFTNLASEQFDLLLGYLEHLYS
jgi:uncharacterized protein (TIGR02266 family)